jgi:L-cysteine:1D-myo-inositol 2-amino-2-deoxy-alpha-D-glucopyranoside ligase
VREDHDRPSPLGNDERPRQANAADIEHDLLAGHGSQFRARATLPSVRLYDERLRDLAEVEVTPHMTLYVCGITPYDSAHMGHAFTYVQFDVLARYLRHLGAEVTHVQNVTDVDDDILRVAAERGIDYRKLAETEMGSFDEQMRALNLERPTMEPRATEYVRQIIEEVAALEAGGHTYERDGTVLFRVSSFPGYGALSGLDRETMIELARERGGFPDDPRKDDPLDFVLWQASAHGEPWWESPWGRGRPGWHIECSTMSRRLLGQPLDIHGGGRDLIFPHHESEIAQAESIEEGVPFVRHWMHTGMVACEATKMSKSLGNLVFVRDLLQRHDPVAIRRALLRHHYRDDWSFSEEEIEREERLLEDPSLGSGTPPRAETFLAALDQDLDTPAALDVLDRAAAQPDDPACRELVEMGRAILRV